MKQFLDITKALSDETRVRALLSLANGELCVCQIIGLLELSPSTVSKHMSILHDAGLVERRKEGRWHYYRLAGKDATPIVRQTLRWVLEHLPHQPAIKRDAAKLCCVKRMNLKEAASCYCPD
jgi:DNA-binding transcriptional ArsR family regulator